MKLTYAIKFVKDMDQAVRFHREVLGLELKFQSSEWSEFSTGDVTLALHPASEANPAGRVGFGSSAKGLEVLYPKREQNKIRFLSPPKPLHGALLASFAGSEGES